MLQAACTNAGSGSIVRPHSQLIGSKALLTVRRRRPLTDETIGALRWPATSASLTKLANQVRKPSMATHETRLEIRHGITIVNTDIDVEVRADGRRLGILKISRGSIDWITSPKQIPRRLSWERFAELAEQHGELLGLVLVLARRWLVEEQHLRPGRE